MPTAAAIILYNLLRGYLTLTIGVLRDQADRVQRTPTLEEYFGHCHPLAENNAGWRRIVPVWFKRGLFTNPLAVIGPWRLHQIANVLFWLSVLSVGIHVIAWLVTTTVPVPN